MRCPKCGYNSFDYLESCKKCGKELVEYKQRYGIKSVLFPGQMSPVMTAESDSDNSVVDAAISAATVVAAAGSVAPASEADDFGFDFMGESAEEEDLSFDELFEEAPVDEDVEETLPSPEKKPADEGEDATGFSFDNAAKEDAATKEVSPEPDLDNDFGFDLDESAEIATGDGPAEDLASDDFDLPPAEEKGFDFNSDEIEFGETAEEKESEGDPKDPFELPESSQDEGAPEQNLNFITGQPLPVVEEDSVDKIPELAPVVTAAVPEASEPLIEELQEPLSDPFAEDDMLLLTEVDESHDVASARGDALVTEIPEEVAAAAELFVDGDLATGAAAAIATPAENEESLAAGYDGAQPESLLVPPLLSRVAAFFCDLVLLSAVSASFIVAAETAMSGKSDRLLPSIETLVDLSIPYFLVLFSLAFGYFTLFHFLVGQTPGKMLAGLRVETLGGEPLGLSQAFLRSVGGLLQLLPVGLGYLVVLLSPDRRGWNDRLAGTRLISLKG